MPKDFIFFLTVHIIAGVIGIAFFYNVTMNLLKKDLNLSSLRRNAFLGWLSFIVSWLAGGYYYVLFYGKEVKPLIKGGAYPWAHNFIMELKEHLFLFLPFLAFLIFIFIALKKDELKENQDLRKMLALISLLVFILGLIIAFMGIFISGAVQYKVGPL
jgi:hypothetical protein